MSPDAVLVALGVLLLPFVLYFWLFGWGCVFLMLWAFQWLYRGRTP